MRTFASLARNIFLQIGEGPDGKQAVGPIAEVVLTAVEVDYVTRMAPSPIEGGQPRPEQAKAFKTETFKFAANASNIEQMIEYLTQVKEELDSYEEERDSHVEAAKEPEESTHASLVI